jgi:GT2 family glycosyltransferase
LPTEERTEGLESAAPRVTAVVVLWNSGAVAIDLLNRLEGAFAAGLRAVFVDNASGDGSFEALRTFLGGWQYGRRVELLQTTDNIGFSAGVNLGTEQALAAEPRPEFVWMLNPDADVTPETLAELVTVAEGSGAAIVSAARRTHLTATEPWPGAFYLPPNRFQKVTPSGRWWPTLRYSGSCALVRTATVERLVRETGYFQDARLFMYWDEWDCSLRAAELGLGLVEAAGALHTTPEPGQAGRDPIGDVRRYYIARNAILVTSRHLPAWRFWPLFGLRLARDTSWFVRCWFRRRESHAAVYFRGTWDGVRGRTGRWKRHPEKPPASR